MIGNLDESLPSSVYESLAVSHIRLYTLQITVILLVTFLQLEYKNLLETR